MRHSRSIHALLLALALAGVARAQTVQVQTLSVVRATGDGEQTQSATTTVQSFKAVEGADLMTRLEAAHTQARNSSTPYWSAYAFDVRPGVAVDPAIREFNGSINTIGDTSVFVGTTVGGVTVETRSLAVFLLREPANNQITRMEVYNLERKREYSGYPVYWLSRANNEESLNYLRAIAAAAPLDILSERAVLAIALHDDARVGGMLKNFITTSPNQRIRSSSVYWLGQVGGEQAFLAGIVRNEEEDKKLRRQAAHSIGASRDQTSLATLQDLYNTIKDLEIHRSIVQAAGNIQPSETAFAFLQTVTKTDPDLESRRVAVGQMGHFEGDRTADELIRIYQTETNVDIRRTALRSLAETKSPKAQTRLWELARTEPNNDLRRAAIRVLASSGRDASVDGLIKLYDSEKVVDIRRSILQSLSEIKGTRVEDKLFDVARNDETLELRRQAIRLLGERATKRSLDFLSATAQSPDGTAEVQVQAVRAIGERHSEEIVPLLIKIAKTHPNQLVRKQAMRSLGESGDPRAVEFFREVLTK